MTSSKRCGGCSMASNLDKLERFRGIWIHDVEFYHPAEAVNAVSYQGRDGETHVDTGNLPVPVALTAYELRTKTRIAIGWPELLQQKDPPYPINDQQVFIAFYAAAEQLAHASLGWSFSPNIIDLYAEFRRAFSFPRLLTKTPFYKYNGVRLRQDPDPFPYPPRYVPELDDFDPAHSQSFSLLAAREAYRLPPLMSCDHKDAMRRRIMRGPPYQAEEMRDMLLYCSADTLALVDLLDAMVPEMNVDLALLRGDYVRAIAHQEHHGVPIDRQLFPQILESLPTIHRELIRATDAAYGFFDEGHFTESRFLHYLQAHRIPWLLTRTGKPSLRDEYLKEQCDIYPELEPFRQLRKTVVKGPKLIVPVGKDFRHRTMLSPFGTITGRNAPSRSLFGQAKWMRFLAAAETSDHLYILLDWSQEELGIGACLSGDLARQRAYLGVGEGDQHRDFYMILADILGVTRDQAKVFTLAEQYGAGPQTLARRLKWPTFVIRRFMRSLHHEFPVFYDWLDRIVNAAYRDGKLETALGWQLLIPKHGANVRTIGNFLIQGYGADLLRASVSTAIDQGLNVIATMHDSVLLYVPIEEAEAQREAMLEIMAEVSRELLDGFELIAKPDVQTRERYVDDTGEAMWRMMLKILKQRGHAL
jgi:DNA polymerase I